MTVDQERDGTKGQGKGRRAQRDPYWEEDAYYYNQFENDKRNRGQGKGKGEGKGRRSERKEEGEDGENPFEERRSRNVTCFNCGEKGHGVKECPFPLSCDMCGQKGHTENKCWMRGPCLNCGGDHHLNMCEEKRWTCSHCGRTGHISNRCFDLVGGRREVMQRKEEEKNRSQMLSSRQVQYAIRQYGWVAVEATGQVPEKTDTLIGAHGHTLFTLPLEVSSDFPNVHVCDMRDGQKWEVKATDGVNFDEFMEVYGSKTSFVSLFVDDSTPKIFVGRTQQSPVYCLDLPTAQWKAIETNTPGAVVLEDKALSRPIAYKNQIIFLGDTEVWILDTTTFQWRVQVVLGSWPSKSPAASIAVVGSNAYVSFETKPAWFTLHELNLDDWQWTRTIQTRFPHLFGSKSWTSGSRLIVLGKQRSPIGMVEHMYVCDTIDVDTWLHLTPAPVQDSTGICVYNGELLTVGAHKDSKSLEDTTSQLFKICPWRFSETGYARLPVKTQRAIKVALMALHQVEGMGNDKHQEAMKCILQYTDVLSLMPTIASQGDDDGAAA
uniref:CCHC-type domain-containing protein n=1 Tax=Eutreptiella gymnastica TaxID=73025 RepID=A0A7S1I8X6_9EUGL